MRYYYSDICKIKQQALYAARQFADGKDDCYVIEGKSQACTCECCGETITHIGDLVFVTVGGHLTCSEECQEILNS